MHHMHIIMLSAYQVALILHIDISCKNLKLVGTCHKHPRRFIGHILATYLRLGDGHRICN